MPRRRQAAKARRGELTLDMEFELTLGPSHVSHSMWPSDEARRAAYFANRDQVMDGPAGSRPWAWWEYESGRKGWPSEPYLSGDEATAWLRKQGFLTAWEERELAARRREDADTAAATLAPDLGDAS